MLEKSFKKRIINFFNTISHSSNYYIKLKTNNSHIYVIQNLFIYQIKIKNIHLIKKNSRKEKEKHLIFL
ncbi:hypothetical protein PFMALIP_05780 [Plasmodium falciparum MaliPS096_E11]|uniref:Uncharacterized protein n=1 Tax=Plasmodium falciparum MaliPS096_E11 TaxID=1036727 RepID=A0A024WHZ9_PLAFA|nr:hypothetical protein PFMALIP_05780 [Plasmodium falciparum MaliPS096_E11]